MDTVTSQGDQKVEHRTKGDAETDMWEKQFACNHVIVNLKEEKGKKGSKGKQETVSFCVMCGEKVKDVGIAKKTKKKDKKRGQTKPEPLSLQTESVIVRRDSSAFSEISEESVDSPSLSRRKETKFSLFGSRRSTSSLSQSVVTSELVEACAMHGHKKLKYFCENHQEICCSVCVNFLHPKCDRVMFIRDEIDTDDSDMEPVDLTLESMRNVKQAFEDIVDVNEQTKRRLEKQKLEARERRDQLKKTVMKLFDDFEKKSEKQMDKFISMETQQLNSVIETCNDAIGTINKCLETLEYASDTRNSYEIFVATHKAVGQKPSFAIALSEALKNTKDVHIDFIAESNIESLDTIKSVGEMCFSAEEKQFPEFLMKSVSKIKKPNVRSPRSVTDIFTQNPTGMSPRQPSPAGKYNVTLSDDKHKCEHVGVTLMPDGKVALIDLNNWKLKVFDSKFRQGSSLKLTSGPRGLVVVGPQELAVSLPDEGKIQFVSVVAKTLKALRTILTEIPCYGIANHNQELVLLCDDGFSMAAIQFMDMDGEVRRNIEMKKSSSRTVLKNPWSITLNPDGQKLCITDRGRLVCMDISGHVIFVYKHEQLENARGVTIDSTGRFYVCGANNVHQVSPDGSRSKILLNEDDVTSPHAICYDPDKRLLLITSAGSDVVSAFKVKKLE